MSGIIPKEQLGGYQRWQIGSFDRPAAPEPAPPAPASEPVAEAPPRHGEPTLPTAEELDRIREEARQAGYEAGFSEGRTAAEQAGEESARLEVAHLRTLVGNFEQSLVSLEQAVADQVLDLALEVASQLARASIKTQNDYLLPVIKEAIASLPLHHAHVAVHLHPSDAVKVRGLHGEQLAQSGMQILENSDISPGGCRLMAGASEVDATIETRWTRVLEAIGAHPREWLKLE